jgi:tetratricopeptide (TPR) repeat protein
VRIDPIFVSDRLTKQGYTPEVIAGLLRSTMIEIEHSGSTAPRQDDSTEHPQDIQTKSDEPDFTVPGTENTLSAILSYVKSHLGFPDRHISGVVLETSGAIKVVLTITPPPDSIVAASFGDGLPVTISNAGVISVSSDRGQSVENAIRHSARLAMREVEPYAYAAYLYATDTNEDETALAAVEDIVRRLPPTKEDTKWAYNLWGIILADNEMYYSALEKYEMALRIDPFFVPALNDIGNTYRSLAYENLTQGKDDRVAYGYFKLAEKYFSQYASSTGGTDTEYYNLGLINEDLANFEAVQSHMEAAINSYRASIMLNPSSGDAYNGLGVDLYLVATFFDLGSREAWRRLSDLEDAASSLRRAAELNNTDPEPYFELSLTLRDLAKVTSDDNEAYRLNRESDTRFCQGLHAFGNNDSPTLIDKCETELLNSKASRVGQSCEVAGKSCDSYLSPE